LLCRNVAPISTNIAVNWQCLTPLGGYPFESQNHQYKNENVLKSVTIGGFVCKRLWRLKAGKLAVKNGGISALIPPTKSLECPFFKGLWGHAIAFPIQLITKGWESDFLY
jgi:hypothetical protein